MKGRSWHMHRRCSWEKWIMLPSVLSQPTLQSIGLVSYLTSDLLLKISIIQPTLSFWPSEIWGKKSIVREEINQTFWRIYTSEWWRRNCTIIWEKTCFTVSNIPLNQTLNRYIAILLLGPNIGRFQTYRCVYVVSMTGLSQKISLLSYLWHNFLIKYHCGPIYDRISPQFIF